LVGVGDVVTTERTDESERPVVPLPGVVERKPGLTDRLTVLPELKEHVRDVVVVVELERNVEIGGHLLSGADVGQVEGVFVSFLTLLGNEAGGFRPEARVVHGGQVDLSDLDVQGAVEAELAADQDVDETDLISLAVDEQGFLRLGVGPRLGVLRGLVFLSHGGGVRWSRESGVCCGGRLIASFLVLGFAVLGGIDLGQLETELSDPVVGEVSLLEDVDHDLGLLVLQLVTDGEVFFVGRAVGVLDDFGPGGLLPDRDHSVGVGAGAEVFEDAIDDSEAKHLVDMVVIAVRRRVVGVVMSGGGCFSSCHD